LEGRKKELKLTEYCYDLADFDSTYGRT
jgi:hypothetical protein